VKRRSFLTAIASLVPAVAASDFSITQAYAQAPAPPDSRELHVLGSGEDRSGKAHSLGFSTILFKVTSAETEGRAAVRTCTCI
jgi:hypothetical protein